MTDTRPQSTPRVLPLSGQLPGNWFLAQPVDVVVEPDGDEILVSEPRFHMHASAPTEEEALSAFRRVLSGYLDFLSANEDHLSGQLRTQLDFLRQMIQ